MIFSDLRVALYVIFVVTLIWRGTVGIPEGYWPYTLAFAVLTGITRSVERAADDLRLKRDVAYLTALDPDEAERTIGRMWSAYARRTYAQLLREEGAVERDGAVERFPYPASTRRTAVQLYWTSVGAALAAVALLFTLGRGLPAWGGWLLWAGSALLAGSAAWWRRRTRELAATLEISPFGLTAVAADGARRAVRWGQPLVLHNRPRRRRVELVAGDGRPPVHIEYGLLGFVRLLRLVIEYGGFREPEAPAGGASAGAAEER